MKNNSQNPIKSHNPLASWDVFSLFLADLQQKQKDINRLNALSEAQNWVVNWDFDEELHGLDHTILVVNLQQEIIFASANVYSMTGYTAQELLGQSPKILQGEHTDPAQKNIIRDSLVQSKVFKAELTNYRKSGQPYTCRIEGHPVFDKSHQLVNYIAFEEAVRA